MSFELPTGAVTFLLSDVEGSSRLWETAGNVAGEAIARHEAIIASAVASSGGSLLKQRGEGDSTFSVFARPSDALAAAAGAQLALHEAEWPEDAVVRVRMGIHTGEAELRESDYFGTTPNRCARIRSVAHGGQTLLSEATSDLVRELLPPGVTLKDLGLHRLKDLERSERIHQMCVSGLISEFPRLRSVDAGLASLPVQRTSFVGRTRETERVDELLKRHQLVTLIGIGGCGKTRLATEVAGSSFERFRDGMAFVNLAPLADPEPIVPAIASALGLALGGLGMGAARPAIDEVLAFLAPRSMLVVLDNCEHLIDDVAAVVEAILDRCPNTSVLATSREGLGVEGEQAFSVPSLDLGVEAVQLFADRARALRPDFQLDEHRSAVAEICQRLDGIPLAIELAAAQVDHLPTAEIAKRLDDRFRLLVGGRRRVQRQQTLQGALDWSHDLLTDAERVLLRRASVFQGGFTAEGAEVLCADGVLSAASVRSVLGGLVRKSLIVTEGEVAPRYRMLETVRLYALDKLLEAGESESFHSRHYDWCMSMLDGMSEAAFSDSDIRTVLLELDNLRTALAWALGNHDADGAARLAGAIAFPLAFRDTEGAARLMSAALDASEALSEERRIALLSKASFVSMVVFDPPALLRQSKEAIALAAGRPFSTLKTAYSALVATATVTDDPASQMYIDEGLQTFSSGPDRATILYLQAQKQMWDGDLRSAVDTYRDARQLTDMQQDPFVILSALSGESLALHLLADHEEALRTAILGEEMTRASAMGSIFGALGTDFPLAIALAGARRFDEAEAVLRTMLEEMRRTVVPANLTTCFVAFAVESVSRGEIERAARLLGISGGSARTPEALTLYRHYRDRVREALGRDRGRTLRNEGRAMSMDEGIAYALEGID